MTTLHPLATKFMQGLALASALLLLTPAAHAANFTWDGEGGDDGWGTPLNWVGNTTELGTEQLSLFSEKLWQIFPFGDIGARNAREKLFRSYSHCCLLSAFIYLPFKKQGSPCLPCHFFRFLKIRLRQSGAGRPRIKARMFF